MQARSGIEAPTNDAQLLRAWRGGDERSGQRLFARHFDALDRFFRRKLPDECEDLVQRTLLAAVEKADQVRNEENFRAFLFGVARFELLRALRRRARKVEPFDSGRASLARLTQSPSRFVLKRQRRELIEAALREIPLDLQILCELHYWEELTLEEAARVIEVPVGTAKSRLRRAKAALTEVLRRHLEADASAPNEAQLLSLLTGPVPRPR